MFAIMYFETLAERNTHQCRKIPNRYSGIRLFGTPMPNFFFQKSLSIGLVSPFPKSGQRSTKRPISGNRSRHLYSASCNSERSLVSVFSSARIFTVVRLPTPYNARRYSRFSAKGVFVRSRILSNASNIHLSPSLTSNLA